MILILLSSFEIKIYLKKHIVSLILHQNKIKLYLILRTNVFHKFVESYFKNYIQQFDSVNPKTKINYLKKCLD
jgi:hypothetical protein